MISELLDCHGFPTARIAESPQEQQQLQSQQQQAKANYPTNPAKLKSLDGLPMVVSPKNDFLVGSTR